MILDALRRIANQGSSLTRDESRAVIAEVLRAAKPGRLTSVVLPIRGTIPFPEHLRQP